MNEFPELTANVAVKLVKDVSGKDENFETCIGREEVVNVDNTNVCRLHECVRNHALADNKLRRIRLMLVVHNSGELIADTDSTREPAERLKCTNNT